MPKVKTTKAQLILVIVLLVSLAWLGLFMIGISIWVKYQSSAPISLRPGYDFSSCKLLADSCINEECKYFFLCNEKEITKCKVYDCGQDYGIEIIEKDGKFISKKKAKPDPKKVQEMVDRCRGEIEILDKRCDQGNLMVHLKVNTKGECIPEAFLVDLGEKNYTAPQFEKKGDSFYLKVEGSCDVSEIIAIGPGGVGIKGKIEGQGAN